ncbi:AraC family transcriptional regulator [Membranihabitans marinus]
MNSTSNQGRTDLVISLAKDNIEIPFTTVEEERSNIGSMEGLYEINTASVKADLTISDFKEFQIYDLKIALHDAISIHINKKQAPLQFIFAFEGRGYIQPNKSNIIPPHSFNIHKHDSLFINYKDKNIHCILIQLQSDFLKDSLVQLEEFNGINKLLEKIDQPVLWSKFKPITTGITQLLNDIILSPQSDTYRKILIKLRLIELLLTTTTLPNQTTENKLPARDQEKIILARDIVTKNYIHPLSLKDLAKKVGTNEFILKKGFKTLYGQTVFGFVQDLKMEEALRLLKQKEIKIQEVAERVGYKHSQHFSTAFKKKFGRSPREYV